MQRQDVAREAVPRADEAPPVAIKVLRPAAVRLLAGEQRARAGAPEVGEPLLACARVHRAGREHRARRAEQQFVRRVLHVRGDRLREGVRGHGRRHEAVRYEQDPARTHEQRRARTILVGRRERGLVEAHRDRRAVDGRDVQARLREPSERVEHPCGAGVDAAQDPVRGRPWIVVAGMQRPEALRVERRLGVAADRSDRVAGPRRAPPNIGKRLVTRGVIQRLHAA